MFMLEDGVWWWQLQSASNKVSAVHSAQLQTKLDETRDDKIFILCKINSYLKKRRKAWSMIALCSWWSNRVMQLTFCVITVVIISEYCLKKRFVVYCVYYDVQWWIALKRIIIIITWNYVLCTEAVCCRWWMKVQLRMHELTLDVVRGIKEIFSTETVGAWELGKVL